MLRHQAVRDDRIRNGADEGYQPHQRKYDFKAWQPEEMGGYGRCRQSQRVESKRSDELHRELQGDFGAAAAAHYDGLGQSPVLAYIEYGKPCHANREYAKISGQDDARYEYLKNRAQQPPACVAQDVPTYIAGKTTAFEPG